MALIVFLIPSESSWHSARPRGLVAALEFN
jgi:hypothetical protein